SRRRRPGRALRGRHALRHGPAGRLRRRRGAAGVADRVNRGPAWPTTRANAMKAATVIGIAIAAVGILGSASMEGTSPAAFMNIPAILIIMAGTGGVTMAAVGMEKFKTIPVLYK